MLAILFLFRLDHFLILIVILFQETVDTEASRPSSWPTKKKIEQLADREEAVEAPVIVNVGGIR